MKTFKLLVFILLMSFLGGCAFLGKSTEVSYSNSSLPPVGRGFEEGGFEESIAMSERDYAGRSLSVVVDDGGFVEGVEQKIIHTGNLSLHVEDVREAVEIIKTKVSEWRGDLSESNITRYDTSYSAYLTLRVPSEQFNAAMSGLKELAVYVNSESTSAENITETYIDLQARLNNLKAEEQQYLEILDKAVTVEEILQVTDYLSRVRGDIESIEAQLQYYDSQVDYSTIYLSLTEDQNIAVAKENWRPLGTIRDALSDWLVFLQRLVDLGIYLVIFGWPVAAIVWGGWYLFHRRRRRRGGH